MTSIRNTVLYTGVTNDLRRRVFEHRSKIVGGFTKRYNVTKLVYYEIHDQPYDAIVREKKIKGGSRAAKVSLIESANPEWRDLGDEMVLV